MEIVAKEIKYFFLLFFYLFSITTWQNSYLLLARSLFEKNKFVFERPRYVQINRMIFIISVLKLDGKSWSNGTNNSVLIFYFFYLFLVYFSHFIFYWFFLLCKTRWKSKCYSLLKMSRCADHLHAVKSYTKLIFVALVVSLSLRCAAE